VSIQTSGTVTELLHAWSDGDDGALERLTPLVEAELRRLARGYMARERRGHTLQATALVNEAFLRLTDAQHLRWQDRAHFLGISARLMRRVLVDHARSRGYRKRGSCRCIVCVLVSGNREIDDVMTVPRSRPG
jgi:RNA polymerase sigma-70 factor (ECF subfamily)